MTESRLEYDGAGRRLSLYGPLDFDSVPALFAALPAGLDTESFEVDLGGVTRADSAGMGFLLALLRQAGTDGVHFSNVPDQLKAIIRVNGLESAFGL